MDVIDLNESEKIIATTKVTIPQGDGPIEATSTLQAVPSSLYAQIDKATSAERPYEYGAMGKENVPSTPAKTVTLSTPFRQSMKMQEQYPVPSAPPLQEIISTQPKLLLNLQGRLHEFSNRTILRPETCVHCAKKYRTKPAIPICRPLLNADRCIFMFFFPHDLCRFRVKFGASALKCRTCGITVHQDCKMSLSIGCVPRSQGTPSRKNGKQGLISEYVPLEGPMVPGLIVRCIDEVSLSITTPIDCPPLSGS